MLKKRQRPLQQRSKTQQQQAASEHLLKRKEEEEEMKFVFTVIPDTVVLNPKMGIMVEFRANSS